MRTLLVPACVLVALTACGTPEETAAAPTPTDVCITDHPVEVDGFGDNDPDAAELECTAAGGTDCAASAFVSIEAARCIAALEGLEAGIADWSFGLYYYTDHGTVAWSVMNTLVQEGASSSGRALHLHATTGALLAQLEWEAMP